MTVSGLNRKCSESEELFGAFHTHTVCDAGGREAEASIH